jgi:hypothetical protein
VRRGTGDFARWYGVDWQELTTRRGSLLDRRVADEAEDAEYVVSALVLSEAFGRVKALHVRGRGAGTIASALVAEHPELRATILAAPSELHALSQLHQAHERVANEPTGPLSAPTEPADAVLFAGATLTLPDADAVFALRAHAEQLTPGGRVLVFERVLDPARADEHDYEQDLIEFALTGGGVRSDQEMRRIFSDAGLHVAHRSTVGWGYTLYELLP